MKPNRTLSYLGMAIVVVLGVFMIVGAVLPKHYSVERSLLVDAAPQTVFEQVVDLKQHEAWTPWLANDDTMALSFGDPWVGEGAVYTWTSERSGEGSTTITRVVPNAVIETHVVFDGQGEARGHWSFEQEGAGTRVTWGYEGSIGGILGGYYALTMDRAVGRSFEDGLARLAAIAEAAPGPLGPVQPGQHRGVLTLGSDDARMVRCGEDRPRSFRDALGEPLAPLRARAAEAPVRVYVELEAEPADGAGLRGTRLLFADPSSADVGCAASLARGVSAAGGTDPAWSAQFDRDGLWIEAPGVPQTTLGVVASVEVGDEKRYTAHPDDRTTVMLGLRPGTCTRGEVVTGWTAVLTVGDRSWSGCGRRGLEQGDESGRPR